MLDAEEFRLARQLFAVFRAAGIEGEPAFRVPSPRELLLGAEIAGPESEQDFVVVIEKAFQSSPVGLRSHREPTEPGTPVVFYIGVKPFASDRPLCSVP